MIRRKFFHILGGVVAGSVFSPFSGSRSQAANSSSPPPADVAVKGFDEYTDDYSQFCATPASERVFYVFRQRSYHFRKAEQPALEAVARNIAFEIFTYLSRAVLMTVCR
jgi:hypothetical protein